MGWVRKTISLLHTTLLMTRVYSATTEQFSNSSGSTMTYCTFDTRPFVTCPENGSIYGLGISVANTIEVSQGNELSGEYEPVCLSSRKELLEKLEACECDAAVGDFSYHLFPELRDTGIQLSTPYHPTSYLVVQRNIPNDSSSIWKLFKPFTASLWLLVIFTPLALAVFMTFFSWAISSYKKTKFSLGVFPQYMFQNALAFLNDYTSVQYMDWQGPSSYMLFLKFLLQSMLVAYAFLCMIVTSVYTAQLTNIILRTSLRQETETFESIVKGTTTLSVPIEMQKYFRTRYNVETIPWVPDSTQNFTDQLEYLRTGAIDGIVTTSETALWAIKNQNPECRLSVNPNAYTLNSGHVILYSPCVSVQDILVRDRVISDYTQRGVFEFVSQSILGDFDVSSTLEGCVGPQSAISIYDVAGGWVILAVGVAAPFLFALSRYLYFLVKKFIAVYGSFFFVGSPPASETHSEYDHGCTVHGGDDTLLDVRPVRISNATSCTCGTSSNPSNMDTSHTSDGHRSRSVYPDWYQTNYSSGPVAVTRPSNGGMSYASSGPVAVTRPSNGGMSYASSGQVAVTRPSNGGMSYAGGATPAPSPRSSDAYVRTSRDGFATRQFDEPSFNIRVADLEPAETGSSIELKFRDGRDDDA